MCVGIFVHQNERRAVQVTTNRMKNILVPVLVVMKNQRLKASIHLQLFSLIFTISTISRYAKNEISAIVQNAIFLFRPLYAARSAENFVIVLFNVYYHCVRFTIFAVWICM